jgi:ABC-type phosphate transport system substrate-binding protein
MNRTQRIVLLALLAVVVTAGVVGTIYAAESSQIDEKLKIRGSTTVFPIVDAIKDDYAAISGNWEIDVAAAGTSTGLRPLAAINQTDNATGGVPGGDRIEIGMASSQFKDSSHGCQYQNDSLGVACVPVGSGSPPYSGYQLANLVENKISRDALVMVIPKQLYDAGITNISPLEVAKIYNCAGSDPSPITNWNQLAVCSQPGVTCPNRTIVPQARVEDSGTYATHIDFVSALGTSKAEEDSCIGTHGGDGARHVGNPDVAAAIIADNSSATPSKIGYVGIGFIDTDPTKMSPMKLDGVEPNQNTVYSDGTNYQKFPWSRWLYLYHVDPNQRIQDGQGPYAGGGSPDDPWNSQVENFVQFARADCSGQKKVAEEDFVKIWSDRDVNKNAVVNISDVTKVGLSWLRTGFTCGVNTDSTCSGDALCYRRDVSQNGTVNITDITQIGLSWQLTYTAP